MTPPSRRLPLIAVAAFGLYALACRPAFSPDGRQIAVTRAREGQWQVLVFDRRQQTWSVALEQSGAPSHKLMPATVVWAPNLVAIWATGEKDLLVCSLPASSAGPVRLFEVKGCEAPYLPPPVVGRKLLLSGNGVTVLDLDSGVVSPLAVPGWGGPSNPVAVVLSAQPDGIGCLVRTSNQCVIGRLQLDPPHLSVLTSLSGEATNASGFFALSPTDSRWALAVSTSNSSAPSRVLIGRGERADQALDFGTADQPTTVGQLAWSADGRALYAASFAPQTGGQTGCVFAVQEISVADGRVAPIPLFAVPVEPDDAAIYYQFALAPDGRTLAAFSGVVVDNDQGSPAEPALYLVDLRRADRRVRKIPLPGQPRTW